jgi:hypothetical protein
MGIADNPLLRVIRGVLLAVLRPPLQGDEQPKILLHSTVDGQVKVGRASLWVTEYRAGTLTGAIARHDLTRKKGERVLDRAGDSELIGERVSDLGSGVEK